ncbi:MAG: 2-dehydropantoate 2-reductase [SAR324 cluster bacterium]|nr:2-dehydropantoate 2-reductase [SAR324 cluster bacterium]
MNIVVVGTGGLGGYYGARLARAGSEVTFFARGAQLAALREGGLRVESVQEPFTLPSVRATDRPAELAPADLVLVTVKSYGLEEAVRMAAPAVGPRTAVLPLLNGVDISERIGAIVGMERVLGGLAYVFAFVAEPGVIRQVSPFDRIQFGELGGGLSERGRAIESVLRDAGIDATQVEDVRAALWTKFLMLTASAGLTALTRSTIGPIRTDPDTRALLEGCMHEVEALARKQGIALEEGIVARTLEWMEGLPGDLRPSMLLDLEQGRPLELEALNGTVARLGQKLGVPVPINRFIHAALKLHAAGAGNASA